MVFHHHRISAELEKNTVCTVPFYTKNIVLFETSHVPTSTYVFQRAYAVVKCCTLYKCGIFEDLSEFSITYELDFYDVFLET